MRSHPGRFRRGFTLLELAVATALTVIITAVIMSGLVYSLGHLNRSMLQNELDIDVQSAMERIKYDMRLSSQDQMLFYPPGSGPYDAISFPLSRDADGDGLIDTDPSTGKIVWYEQVIYHVWVGEPTQLRRTVFNPRLNLSAAERQAQLVSVVTNGNGSATYGAAGAATAVVFENLFKWSLSPRLARFDGYASALQRYVGAQLGSCVVTSGVNTFRFNLVGKNTSSSGYAVGVDSIAASPSYSTREGEAQLGGVTGSGATPVAQYMPNGSWDGNYQLRFPATATGQSFTVAIENDRWEETNFRATGEVHSNTTVAFDTSLTPADFVVCLDGMRTNWLASSQTGDTNGTSRLSGDYRGCAARVLIKGWDMPGGGWLDCGGGSCRVLFRAGDDGGLTIRAASIAECAMSTNTTPDAAGSPCGLRFAGANTLDLAAGAEAWSDYAAFSIDRKKSYLVTFYVSSASPKGSVREWQDATGTSIPHAFVAPAGGSASEALVTTATWSTLPDLVTTAAIPSVAGLFVSHPTNGTYTSAIFDTHVASPSYSTMGWSNILSSGTMAFRVRTSNLGDMSDSPTWIGVTAPGLISPGSGRYVQFQASLRPDSTCLSTPKLNSVLIRWPGETRAVDIAANLTQGPDYGIFEVQQVGSQGVLAGVLIELEIFEDLRALGGIQRVTSSLTSEIRPRNTGW